MPSRQRLTWCALLVHSVCVCFSHSLLTAFLGAPTVQFMERNALKAKPKPRRAVIYLRVSTDEQAASGLGMDAQESTCRAWCASRGLDVVSVHRDDGVSGSTPIDKRSGLTAALAALSRGAVLVAAKRDRLARAVGVAAVLEEAARRMGASVETPDAPDSDDPFAQAMRGMMDVFAQLERAIIAARTTAALAVKRARNEKTGGDLPIGHVVGSDGKTLERSAEFEAVRIIQALRADGLSQADIVARLNALGVPCRGKQWHKTTVARVLARSA